MQVAIVDTVNNIEGVVGRMGDVEPARSAMYRCVIESAGFKAYRQFDVPK